MDFIYRSPLFTERFRGIIRQGVEAYLAGDHPKAISLLVPQIENASGSCSSSLAGRRTSRSAATSQG